MAGSFRFQTFVAAATLLALGAVALPRFAAAGHPHHRGPAQAGCVGCPPGQCGHAPRCGHGQRCGHCGPAHCGHGHCGHGHCFDGHCLHHDTIEKRYFLRSQGKSWHSAWYDPAEGRPIALVVPPTAEFMTQYSWGVPSSRVMPLYHQFRRPYPGPGATAGGGGGFLPTPNQPSDTVQFGVNAVRGPWNGY
jgi:uncharacterized low-complexity protein